jgi:hypothetical protein
MDIWGIPLTQATPTCCGLVAAVGLAPAGGRRSPATAPRSRKARGAIPRREFGPRDLVIAGARITSAGACHGDRRGDCPLLAAGAAEYERRAVSRRAEAGRRPGTDPRQQKARAQLIAVT